MTSEECINRHRLLGVEGLGAATYYRLLKAYGTATAALAAVPMLTARGGRPARPIPSVAKVERELAACASLGVQCLYHDGEGYPALLRHIPEPPPILYARGALGLLTRPAVGIVGARYASSNGMRFAGMLAQDCGKRQLIVVSGLARGIDAAAHKDSLLTGTIAVVAGGVDVVYPRENSALYSAIVASGLVLSTEPPGTQPTARHFPRRNRVIAGLVKAVVVVEAARQSGSLITARLANDYGRDVYAVPHFPLDPRGEGTNHLIAQGAKVCLSADDLLPSVESTPALYRCSPVPASWFATPPQDVVGEPPVCLREKVIALLGASPLSLDALVRDADAVPAAVSTVLLELELAGRLERSASQTLTLVA